jgi:hypothetical protein
MKKPKPYCNGTMTEAAFRSYIMSGLRAKSRFWKPKTVAIAKTFVKVGKNPATGHKCKLHKCPKCKGLFPQSKMDADHIAPVVPVEGFKDSKHTFLSYDWTKLIKRLFCESEGYRVICKECHKKITKKQNQQRRKNK